MPGPVFSEGDTDIFDKLNDLSNALFIYEKHTSNFAAVKGYLYGLDTNALSVTLPAAPQDGDRINFISTRSAVKSVTFLRNGNTIEGSAADVTLTGVNDAEINVDLVYDATGTPQGWRIVKRGAPARGFGGVKSADFTAVRSTDYGIDTGSITVTLPASPTFGDSNVYEFTDHTVTGVTLARNSSNINGAASDVTISAKGVRVMARYMNVAVGWLLEFQTTVNPAPRYDSANYELRYHNSQRELADHVGWAPFALPLNQASSDIPAATQALAANGGTALIPIWVPTHMLLQGIQVRNSDTANLRTLEWRLFKQRLNNGNSGENTIDEIAGANGTDSFTASVASQRTSNASTPGLYLAPGIYWLALRNTSATQTWGLMYLSLSAITGLQIFQTKTLGSSLSATLDAVAATWTKVGGQPTARLLGRVLGQTVAF